MCLQHKLTEITYMTIKATVNYQQKPYNPGFTGTIVFRNKEGLYLFFLSYWSSQIPWKDYKTNYFKGGSV